MIDYKIERLDKENQRLLDNFSCVENNEKLSCFDAKTRRRIKKHSVEMDTFLHEEALKEQEKGLSATYLFVNDSQLLAYLSLCNDAILLNFDEKSNMGFSYATEPAIKIARLAVSNTVQGCGLGKEIIEYAVAISQEIREYSGVVFLTLDCYRHRLSYYSQFGFVKNEIQHIELPFDSPISMRLWIDAYLKLIDSENL